MSALLKFLTATISICLHAIHELCNSQVVHISQLDANEENRYVFLDYIESFLFKKIFNKCYVMKLVETSGAAGDCDRTVPTAKCKWQRSYNLISLLFFYFLVGTLTEIRALPNTHVVYVLKLLEAINVEFTVTVVPFGIMRVVSTLMNTLTKNLQILQTAGFARSRFSDSFINVLKYP